MDITTITALKLETKVIEKKDGISVFIPSYWVVSGEDRVSYTTIIRLVECCREYHWEKDVICHNSILDSICGSLSSRFIKAIEVNSTIHIKYSIKDVKKNRYLLEFIITNENNDICCSIEITSFFYDPLKHQSIDIPDGMFSR
jgi:acyl-CoA thioesterase FadM